jgi:hypothetical protein
VSDDAPAIADAPRGKWSPRSPRRRRLERGDWRPPSVEPDVQVAPSAAGRTRDFGATAPIEVVKEPEAAGGQIHFRAWCRPGRLFAAKHSWAKGAGAPGELWNRTRRRR